MKNKQGVIIGLAVMLVLVGIISVLSVRAAGGRDNRGKIVFSYGGTVELRNTIELPISEVGALEVVYSSRSIQVYPTTGDTIVIKEYLLEEPKEGLATVTYEEMAGEASGRKKAVVKGNQDNVITIFGFRGREERIEVYLPKAGLDSLQVQLGSGNIIASDDFVWETKDLQVIAGSGNIKWRATKSDTMRFRAKSGNVHLEDMEAALEVETGSGNIKLENFVGKMVVAAGSGRVKILDSVGTMAVATGSGNVTVEEGDGNGSFAVGSGTLRVSMEKVTGDISLSAGSGNVNLKLPENLSFTFEGKTGSGNMDTDFDEVLQFSKNGDEATGAVGQNPTCKITVETKSGNIDVTAD